MVGQVEQDKATLLEKKFPLSLYCRAAKQQGFDQLQRLSQLPDLMVVFLPEAIHTIRLKAKTSQTRPCQIETEYLLSAKQERGASKVSLIRTGDDHLIQVPLPKSRGYLLLEPRGQQVRHLSYGGDTIALGRWVAINRE